MLKKSRSHIALYNEYSGTGHFESWTVIFTKLLLEKGYDVTCFTPNCELVKEKLLQAGVKKIPNLISFSHKEISSESPWVQKIWNYKTQLKSVTIRLLKNLLAGLCCLYRIWEINVEKYNNNSNLYREIHKFTLNEVWRKKLLLIIVPMMWEFSRPFSKVFHKFIHKIIDQYPILSHTSELFEIINEVSKHSPDIKFFYIMYLDKYSLPFFPYCKYFCNSSNPWCRKGAISFPWGGLSFIHHTEYQLGNEWFFNQPSFCGLCVLDESAYQIYRNVQPEHVISLLPDITNTELPKHSVPIIQEIILKSNNRSIILLCGSIEGRKNIELFCKVAKIADPDRWFFVIVGQHYYSTFSKEDINALSAFISSPHGNTADYDFFMKNEEELNCLISKVDIIFAVYKNFQISSNMPSKAAFFNKPIIVSERFLMGQIVRKYNIGHLVSEDDPFRVIQAMDDLLLNPIPYENYSAYQEVYNEENMGDMLDLFITNCLEMTK